ncbi:MAG TPA: hypothetical protein VI454_15915 [Verrucomicrobiae bacterium]
MNYGNPIAPEPVRPATRVRARLLPALGFFAASLALCLWMFWPAATGRALLAPLDIAPNLFAKFKYVDPAATGVPANHYIIDLILGDVSRNLLVHEAWRRGEMPWWDPYTDCGRPLAAEAHAVNISDPFKVLIFHLLPFELAYNWVRIVTFLVSGAAAFALLRRFKSGFAAAFWGGLLYQFAGCNAMMFSGPTVQAAFAYFPLLWLCWDKAAEEGRFFWFLISSFVAALIFLSGNLQSHSYVFFFALGCWLGYGWGRWRRLAWLTAGMAVALGLGLCLAAPFVLSQIELFVLSARKVEGAQPSLGMLSGLFSAASVFPWALGTFRTLDVGKIIGQNSLGFWIYIGSAALVIAALGAATKVGADARAADRKRTALWLVGIYLAVCSTPLLKMFYTRMAWLAVLGLVALFALGWEQLQRGAQPLRRWGWSVLALAAAVTLALNVAGGLVYPRFQSRIEKYVLERQSRNITLDEASELRKFQVANYPTEVTFRNREPLVAFLGLVLLGVLLLKAPSAGRGWWLHGVLILSTLPLLWLERRYIPQQPLALWQRLREGGPEQRRLMEVARADGLRVRDLAPGIHEFAFPGALAQLYGVHVMNGHSSLYLVHAGGLTNAAGQPDPTYHDILYRSPERHQERGELEIRSAGGPARFRWVPPVVREVKVVSETLSSLTLRIGPGTAGELLRTDTYFPGWRVVDAPLGTTLQFAPPCFSRLSIPAGAAEVRLVFEPRWWRAGISVGAVTLVLVLLSAFMSRRRARAAPEAVA